MYYAARKNNEHVSLDIDPHGNLYVEGFQSLYFVHEYVDDPKVKALLQDHVSALLSFLLDNDFRVLNAEGHLTTYGDITGDNYLGFAHSAELSQLTMLRIAQAIVEDGSLQERIQTQLKKVDRNDASKAYQKIGSVALASPSTNARTFENFLILKGLGVEEQTREGLEHMWQDVRKGRQSYPVWRYLSLIPKEEWSFQHRVDDALAQLYLQSFPLDRTEREIKNSLLGTDDELQETYWFLDKRGVQTLSTLPLPLYRRGIEGEWNENPFRIDSNIGSRADAFLIPQDFLLAYNLGLLLKSIPLEERMVRKGKVEQGVLELEQIFPQLHRIYKSRILFE